MGATYDELTGEFLFTSDPITITEAHLVLFGSLIGNFHPSHVNDVYSERVGPFKRRVAQGELSSSLMISGLAQVLRETSRGQLGASYRLLKPIFVGDTIYTEITVKEKRMTSTPGRGFVRFGLRTFKQDGSCVAEGTADFLVSTTRLPIYPPDTPAGQAAAAAG
jgi:acyl dehydratase